MGTDKSAGSGNCGNPYRESIGHLMYLMVVKIPDIAFTVVKLAKYVKKILYPIFEKR